METNYAVSESKTTVGKFEIARAITVLENEVQKHPMGTWQDVMDLLVISVSTGSCLKRSLEMDGILVSTIGTIVRSVAENISDLSGAPVRAKAVSKSAGLKMIDLLTTALDRAQIDGLVIVESKHENPEPTLVDKSRRYGRRIWNR